MMQGFKRLEEVFAHQVFELCGPFETSEGNDYYVPYMMNDALEYYLILRNCRLIGEYIHDAKLLQEMQFAENENGYVLVVRQGSENVFTLHFERIEESIQCYQYHAIGHFWVKGQEQWRQLVYMIGTMYDKYEYLGEAVCNEKEIELLKLVGFAPFREWSPIHESLEEHYPETYEGIKIMENLAREAEDIGYLRWILVYRYFPCKMLRNILQKKLLHPKRENLYSLICRKVEEASVSYPKRKYGKEITKEIEAARERLQKEFERKGFSGTYPEYEKGDTKILVTEEHPFTILEWDDYKFRMQLMISQCEKPIINKRNSGFFKGRGRKGWIETYAYKH